MSAEIERLRAAAAKERADYNSQRGEVARYHLAVADWLDGEAALLGSLEPFTELLSAVIENQSGVIGYLKVGHKDDGAIDMRAESTPAALRLADVILGNAQ